MTDAFERLTAALADRYGIKRELGRGGMATVYLAEDLKNRTSGVSCSRAKRLVDLRLVSTEIARKPVRARDHARFQALRAKYE